MPTSPARMSFTTLMLRLPFRHAEIIAKDFARVEVACGTDHRRATPRTFLCGFISWFAVLVSALMIAAKRTVQFILTLKCTERFAARWTMFLNRSYFSLKSWHERIIPYIEIEEKYCEIAVRRLAQEVLPL